MEQHGFITTQEAAKLSGYGERHIRWLWRNGKVNGAHVGRRVIIIEKASLERYMASDPKPGRQAKG